MTAAGVQRRSTGERRAGVSGSSTASGGGRFRAGDPLRGLAALGIGVYHAGTYSLQSAGHLGDLNGYGWTGPFGKFVGGPIGAGSFGIGVFFVLSGYLISRPFVSAFAERRPLPRVGAYLRNRVLRLVPGYWVALAVVLLVAGSQGERWSDAPRLLGFSEDWGTSPLRYDLGQAWTLGVEARYYVAVPIVAVVFAALARLTGRPHGHAARLWLVGAAATAASTICFLVIRWHTQAQFYEARTQAHLLLLGVALAAAELGLSWRWLAGRAGRIVALCAFAGSVGALVWIQYPACPLPTSLPFTWESSIDFIAAVAALLIVGVPVLLQRAGGGCWRALDNRPLRWLGARSYGFYLYQLLVFDELSRHAPDPGLYHRTFVLLIVVGVPAIMLLAAVSWRLVERPALRLKAPVRREARVPGLAPVSRAGAAGWRAARVADGPRQA